MSKIAPQQDELPLSSILAHSVFPGRACLYPAEVAAALCITQEHVLDLIAEGRLEAIDIANGLKTKANPSGNKSRRRFWRIPVSAYDDFVRKAANPSHQS